MKLLGLCLLAMTAIASSASILPASDESESCLQKNCNKELYECAIDESGSNNPLTSTTNGLNCREVCRKCANQIHDPKNWFKWQVCLS
jgi:hypothetical protein